MANIPGQEMVREKGVSVFIFGEAGTWKTTWAAQWPGVVFLSLASEGGDESLETYPAVVQHLLDKSKMPECPPCFNYGRPPIFYIKACGRATNKNYGGRYKANECLMDVLDAIVAHHKAWGVCTVVVDSFTFLIDLWVNELMINKTKDPNWKKKSEDRGGDLMGPPEWGFLNMYLRNIRVSLNNLRLNTIWTALAKENYETDQNNQMKRNHISTTPMISGATRIKLPAQCNLHIFAEKKITVDPMNPMARAVQPIYHTSPTHLVQMIRHRYAFLFPQGHLMDPEFGNYPTFRAVWSVLHPYIYVGQ